MSNNTNYDYLINNISAKTDMYITPQVNYDKNTGSYHGRQILVEQIQRYEQAYGCKNHEIFKATIKEYNKHRGTYDQLANDPVLLLARLPVIVRNLYHKKEEKLPLLSFKDGDNSFFIIIYEYLYKSSLKSENKFFPAPKAEIKFIMNIYDEVAHLLKGCSRGELNESYQKVRHFNEVIMVSLYYIFWENIATTDKRRYIWFDNCRKHMATFVKPENMETFNRLFMETSEKTWHIMVQEMEELL